MEKLIAGRFPRLASCLFADRETLNTFPFDILRDDHWILLKEEVIVPYEPDVVIIDTLRECHTGDENDSTDMQTVISRLESAVKPAALIIVSHSRKANYEAGPDIMNDIRGSSYLAGKMDAVVRFGKTSLRVSGRAIEEQSIPIERDDDYTWNLGEDPLHEQAVLLLETGKPIMELARILHDQTGRSVSSCRAYLRRKAEKRAAS